MEQKNQVLKKMIRVLIVEDSFFIARLLSGILNSISDILVVGIARDGEQAIKMTENLKPDLITMDIQLPKMNGYEATKHIMAYTPTPILVVSSTSYSVEMNMTFNAIYYGALDMIEKGELESQGKDEDFAEKLVEQVRFLSTVKVIRHPMAKIERVMAPFLKREKLKESVKINDTFIVAMAASTGGPQVIFTILKNLPKDLGFALLIVQHIVPSFTEGFAEWLATETGRDVCLPKSGTLIQPNKIYVAPGNVHMKASNRGKIVLDHGALYKGHRPSANVLFQSLADNAIQKSIGVILSGMGSDGLEGLTSMHKKRMPIIAQDEKSCIVYGMPKVCVDSGIVSSVASRTKIANEIINFYLQKKGK